MLVFVDIQRSVNTAFNLWCTFNCVEVSAGVSKKLREDAAAAAGPIFLMNYSNNR